MLKWKDLLAVACASLLVMAPVVRADEPATGPATAPTTEPTTETFASDPASAPTPATTPATVPTKVPSTLPTTVPVKFKRGAGDPRQPQKKTAKISPDAGKLLEQIKLAYSRINTLELQGTFSVDFSIDDQLIQKTSSFKASFAAPDKFRHEMIDDVVIGSTGEHAYIFETNTHRYLRQKLVLIPEELSHDVHAPSGPAGFIRAIPATGPVTVTTQPAVRRLHLTDLPGPILPVLEEQNTSLQLVLAPDAALELIGGAIEVNRAKDVTIDGKDYPTLHIKAPLAELTVAVDPDTFLARRVDEDLKEDLVKRGAENVRRALIRTDYSISNPNAVPPADAFAWSVPPGARAAAVGDINSGGEAPAAMALEGKPAPDIVAKMLDGTDFRLSTHRGSVVVLDFWATWCGPCVGEMPTLDKIYRKKKPDGVEMFLVNCNEPSEAVKKFIDQKGLTPPVVLDTDVSKAQDAYKADAIPQTVVIGKDGTVRKVIIGAGPDSVRLLEQAIEDALRADK